MSCVTAIGYIVHQCYLMIARTLFRDVISIIVNHLYLRISRGWHRVYVGYIDHHLYLWIPIAGVRVDVGYIVYLYISGYPEEVFVFMLAILCKLSL